MPDVCCWCVQVQALLEEVQQLREELRSRDRTITELTLQLVCVFLCLPLPKTTSTQVHLSEFINLLIPAGLLETEQTSH